MWLFQGEGHKIKREHQKHLIDILFYLGCQKIRWKVGTGHPVIEFYLCLKNRVGVTDRKWTCHTNFGQPFIMKPSCPFHRQWCTQQVVKVTLQLSVSLKAAGQNQLGECDLYNTWIDLLSKCQTRVQSVRTEEPSGQLLAKYIKKVKKKLLLHAYGIYYCTILINKVFSPQTCCIWH